MVEYRPVPADHEGYRETTAYAFSPASGPPEGEVSERSKEGDPRALFADGDLRATCKHHWFDARVRGEWLRLAGLAAVASPPQHRRQGSVRRIVREALAEYRERGVPLSALWPFDHRFYARMGWAVANRIVVHEGPPDALAFARDADVGGRYVDLDPDDHGRMDAVLREHAAGRGLTVDRTESWWRRRVFRTRKGEPYAYGWERDGDLRGYLVYRVEEGDDRRLRVVESAHAGGDARLALLAFLSNHDSQVGAVRLREPDAGLLDRLPDPWAVDTELRAGPMVRIVDVADALSALPVPAGLRGRVRLGVADPLADWNDGTFAVAFGDGGAAVERVDGDPDVELGVGALSQLYIGYRSVGDLARTGDARIDGGADLLRTAFPPAEPFLRETF